MGFLSVVKREGLDDATATGDKDKERIYQRGDFDFAHFSSDHRFCVSREVTPKATRRERKMLDGGANKRSIETLLVASFHAEKKRFFCVFYRLTSVVESLDSHFCFRIAPPRPINFSGSDASMRIKKWTESQRMRNVKHQQTKAKENFLHFSGLFTRHCAESFVCAWRNQ
jgi:hypothetical protein